MSRAKTPAALTLLISDIVPGADTLVGTITRDRGALSFTYDADYRRRPRATPLSVSMPLTTARHDDPVVSNFLWGLMSDNPQAIRERARRAHVSPNSALQLLGAYGDDLPGALRATRPDAGDEADAPTDLAPISLAQLKDFMERLVRSPGRTRITEHGGKFSLAGAQPKKALAVTDEGFFEPQGRTPSTHILKPAIPDLDGQVENEHFCLKLASALGLKAARSKVTRIGAIPVIVVERYDRVRVRDGARLPLTDPGGAVIRLHQEDLCQALGVHPARKYQNEDGPSMAAIMDVLAHSRTPDVDRSLFMRACAFNYVIGGTDAHAKNYSLLHAPSGYRLAPLYDVISALPYIDRRNEQKLAMSVDGEYRYDKITPGHWAGESRVCGFDPETAKTYVRDIIARAPAAAASVAAHCADDGLESPVLGRLAGMIADRCAALATLYGADALPASRP